MGLIVRDPMKEAISLELDLLNILYVYCSVMGHQLNLPCAVSAWYNCSQGVQTIGSNEYSFLAYI